MTAPKKPAARNKPRGIAPGTDLSPRSRRLLRLVGQAGLADSEIESQAGLPASFLSRARQGKNEQPQREKLWRRIEVWLAGRAEPGAPPVEEKPDAHLLAFIEEVKQAATMADVDGLNSRVTELLARKVIGPNESRAFVDILKERRMGLDALARERAAAQVGQPQRIEIVFVDDWRTATGGKATAE